MENNTEKATRILGLYTKLINGGYIYKTQEAFKYNVTEKSIQRDIDDIRAFLSSSIDITGMRNDVVYDRAEKGYRLEKIYTLKFTNPEILAICKILLDSRSLTKTEMDSLINKLVSCCVPETNQQVINEMIANEKYHYIQPKHGKAFLQTLWDVGIATKEHKIIEFDYQGVQASNLHHREVKPLGIMNAGMYFYMVGVIENIDKEKIYGDSENLFPTIYRIDRLQNLKISDEHFRVPYKDRFEEGEFRKRIQFMFGGELRKVRFKYMGYSLEAVEDRFPTAKVIKTLTEEVRGKAQTVYVVEVEVYGNGVDQWMRQQGEMVEKMG